MDRRRPLRPCRPSRTGRDRYRGRCLRREAVDRQHVGILSAVRGRRRGLRGASRPLRRPRLLSRRGRRQTLFHVASTSPRRLRPGRRRPRLGDDPPLAHPATGATLAHPGPGRRRADRGNAFHRHGPQHCERAAVGSVGIRIASLRRGAGRRPAGRPRIDARSLGPDLPPPVDRDLRRSRFGDRRGGPGGVRAGSLAHHLRARARGPRRDSLRARHCRSPRPAAHNREAAPGGCRSRAILVSQPSAAQCPGLHPGGRSQEPRARTRNRGGRLLQRAAATICSAICARSFRRSTGFTSKASGGWLQPRSTSQG